MGKGDMLVGVRGREGGREGGRGGRASRDALVHDENGRKGGRASEEMGR
jgi:general stress protein YciG